MKGQFENYRLTGSNNVTWDYSSVKLYGLVDFQRKDSKEKKYKDPKCSTITKKSGGFIPIVYKKQQTQQDMANINALYSCPSRKPPKDTKKALNSPAGTSDGGVGGKLPKDEG